MTPIYILVGFTAGFLSGVNYGTAHKDPWKDLANTATEFVVWSRRITACGPLAPSPDEECPGHGVEEEE
jgi:hypothetical protein